MQVKKIFLNKTLAFYLFDVIIKVQIKRKDKIMNRTSKNEAKKQYKVARENYLNNRTNENWIEFCNAKRICMLLGVII